MNLKVTNNDIANIPLFGCLCPGCFINSNVINVVKNDKYIRWYTYSGDIPRDIAD